MKKRIGLILSAIMLSMAITACGGNANAPVSGEASAPTNAIPTSLDGAYTDGPHYLVVQNGTMSINGLPYEITEIQTDLYEDGTSIYHFTFDGKEESFCEDDGDLMCSIGEDEGSMAGWEEIDMADVPSFTSEGDGQQGDNPFEGKSYRLDGEDSHILEITKLDKDGNMKEVVIDGTALEMSRGSTDTADGNEIQYTMEYEDENFVLRVWYNKSEDTCDVEVMVTDGATPSIDITEGTYYSENTDETSDSSSEQPDFIGKVYNYTDDGGKAHTFTVVSCDENGLISRAKLDENEFSLTDCSLVEGESMQYSCVVFSYKGSFDNVDVTISYYDKPDFFTLDFAYASQDAPSFETINGKFEDIQK
ncbi:MAG: hypothetical protein PHU31_05005 [Anaerotignum sp.]|nr:hypothetical protein [Anaerotignum sp.]